MPRSRPIRGKYSASSVLLAHRQWLQIKASGQSTKLEQRDAFMGSFGTPAAPELGLPEFPEPVPRLLRRQREPRLQRGRASILATGPPTLPTIGAPGLSRGDERRTRDCQRLLFPRQAPLILP